MTAAPILFAAHCITTERPGEREQLRGIVDDVFQTTFAPPPRVTVSECADEHRRLPSTSAEPGRFHTDRIPYMRRIQDVLGDESVREVVFAKSSQVAGSTVGENFILYLMLHAPCAILEVWPTEKKLRAWTQTRLDPMIDDSPALKKKFRRTGRREPGDSLDKKIFPGGWLMAITARSTSDLKSAAARVAIAEEVDEWEGDVNDQGDPLELLRVRMRTFWNGKLYIVSTPTLDGSSRVWQELEASTYEEYWVPCPHCEEMQVLRWRDGDEDDDESGGYRVIWEKDADGEPIPGTARYVCVSGCEIEERHKPWMLERGEWRARFPGRRTVGFHINTLYSPLCTWDDVAAAFRRALKTPGQLKVFVNTWLGLPYKGKGQKLDSEVLRARAERFPRENDDDHPRRIWVPNGVGLLTAGVDVQGDRLEIVVWGWGRGEEAWVLAWDRIEGDPGLPPDREGSPWPLLDEYLLEPWRHEHGRPMLISACAIDANYQADAVHRFCEPRERRNVIPVVGKEGRGQLLVRAATIAQKYKRTKRQVRRRQAHVMKTDAAKDRLFSFLRMKHPGPGYVHFSDTLDPTFFEQLTSETLVTEYVRARPVRVWRPLPDRRSEALDTSNLAAVALAYLGTPVLNRLAELAEQAAEPYTEASAAATTRAAPARRGRRIRSRGIE